MKVSIVGCMRDVNRAWFGTVAADIAYWSSSLMACVLPLRARRLAMLLFTISFRRVAVVGEDAVLQLFFASSILKVQ